MMCGNKMCKNTQILQTVGRVSLVGILKLFATGWTVQGWNPGEGKRFYLLHNGSHGPWVHTMGTEPLSL